jgi:hypothetical protein
MQGRANQLVLGLGGGGRAISTRHRLSPCVVIDDGRTVATTGPDRCLMESVSFVRSTEQPCPSPGGSFHKILRQGRLRPQLGLARTLDLKRRSVRRSLARLAIPTEIVYISGYASEHSPRAGHLAGLTSRPSIRCWLDGGLRRKTHRRGACRPTELVTARRWRAAECQLVTRRDGIRQDNGRATGGNSKCRSS